MMWLGTTADDPDYDDYDDGDDGVDDEKRRLPLEDDDEDDMQS